MTPDRLQDLQRLIAALGAPAMVIGGLAVAVRGNPRNTLDADLTIGMSPAQGEHAAEIALAVGFESRVDDPGRFVRDTRVLPLARISDGWQVDMTFAASPYEEEALGRASDGELAGVRLPVIAAEDLVFHKLVAGRPRDIEDARSVVARSGSELDRPALLDAIRQLAHAIADDELLRRAEAILS